MLRLWWRCFKDVFPRMIVIPTQTKHRLRFFHPLQLSMDKVVLRTGARLDAQPAVGPELSFACASGAGFASMPASVRLESDRCRECGAAISGLYVSGSPPMAWDAGCVVNVCNPSDCR
jgi:hypothetical protein